MLTGENYSRGVLIDDEFMAGVSENPLKKTSWTSYVVRHTTGEAVDYRAFDSLDEALFSINSIPREWKFEKSGGCDGCKDGSCGRGSAGCKLGKPVADCACPPAVS